MTKLPKEYRVRTKPLTPQQAKFVEEYCAGKNATQAAIAAGFAPKAAHTRGWKLLEMVSVQEAVEAYRTKVARTLNEKAVYTVKESMEDIEDLIAFAKKTGNANAYGQAIKMRQALYGLGEKDKGVDAPNFMISIQGLAAPTQSPQPIDVTPVGGGSIFD